MTINNLRWRQLIIYNYYNSNNFDLDYKIMLCFCYNLIFIYRFFPFYSLPAFYFIVSISEHKLLFLHFKSSYRISFPFSIHSIYVCDCVCVCVCFFSEGIFYLVYSLYNSVCCCCCCCCCRCGWCSYCQNENENKWKQQQAKCAPKRKNLSKWLMWIGIFFFFENYSFFSSSCLLFK